MDTIHKNQKLQKSILTFANRDLGRIRSPLDNISFELNSSIAGVKQLKRPRVVKGFICELVRI